MFTLIRTLPDGTTKEQHGFATRRAATVQAGRALYDNGAASMADAQRFSAQLGKLPLGEVLAHASGYCFAVVKQVHG
jgi:hypothetical protein